jgi:hypothetical protein
VCNPSPLVSTGAAIVVCLIKLVKRILSAFSEETEDNLPQNNQTDGNARAAPQPPANTRANARFDTAPPDDCGTHTTHASHTLRQMRHIRAVTSDE